MKSNTLTYNNEIPDPHQLCNLFAFVGWTGTFSDENKIRETLTARPMFVVCVYDKDKLVGFGKTLEDGIRCLIYDIVVNPSYKRRGIGKTIMSELVSYAKAKRYSYVRLFAWRDNPATVPFYESMGFKKMENAMQLDI